MDQVSGTMIQTLQSTRHVPANRGDSHARTPRCCSRNSDPAHREFRSGGVPVQLVDGKIVQPVPHERVQMDDVTTVSLADLINMKLRSGSTSVLRSQDRADVIGLIRANRLTGSFTSKLDKTVRAEFGKLAKAVQNDPAKG